MNGFCIPLPRRAADLSRPLAGWCLAGWLALAAALTPAQAQRPGFGPAPGPVVLRALGRCLEVNEPQLQVNGARVQLQPCDGRPHQLWRRERGQIVNLANGRCLDVHRPDAGFDGARVQTVDCNGTPHQQWRQERGQLMVRVDGRCLEAQSGDGSQPLVPVHTGACHDGPVQRWRVLQPVAPPPALPWEPPVERPAAPVQRDVEAGPLFGQAEAERSCPAVCRPGRWSGRWVTTVPGRMSVCGCVFEPPPAAAPPVRPSMDEERLATLLRLLDDEAFPSNALRLLDMAARDHRFEVDQARRLLEVFAFGSDRLRALETLLPRLRDRASAFELLGAFDFEIERAEARRLLERAGGGR